MNKYFDKIFCVNLDKRTDKWELCLKEFEQAGIDVVRFSAVDGSTIALPPNCAITPGEVGCSLSHTTILKRMLHEGWERILILEDDIEFSVHAPAQFQQWIGQVPADWDMLYLGGNHIAHPIPVTQNVSKIVRTYTTSHYGITKKMAAEVIAEVEKFKSQIDVTYTDFQKTHNCYVFNPSIAWQKPGHSDIQNAFMDYTRLMKPPGQ